MRNAKGFRGLHYLVSHILQFSILILHFSMLSDDGPRMEMTAPRL